MHVNESRADHHSGWRRSQGLRLGGAPTSSQNADASFRQFQTYASKAARPVSIDDGTTHDQDVEGHRAQPNWSWTERSRTGPKGWGGSANRQAVNRSGSFILRPTSAAGQVRAIGSSSGVAPASSGACRPGRANRSDERARLRTRPWRLHEAASSARGRHGGPTGSTTTPCFSRTNSTLRPCRCATSRLEPRQDRAANGSPHPPAPASCAL